MNNPLYAANDLPLFNQIKSEDIEPALRKILADNRNAIEFLLEHKNKETDKSKGNNSNSHNNNDKEKYYTFENLILPLENMNDRLREIWGIVKHLNSVKDNPEWRKAHDAILPEVTEYFINLGQDSRIYQAILSIQSAPEYNNLTPPQQKVVENYLRDYQLSGVALGDARKANFKTLQKKLSEVKNKFEQHVLDATDNWFLLITDESRLRGLPAHTIKKAKLAAENNQEQGWRITLDYPCYHAVMYFAEDRDLRYEVYKGYNTLASDQSTLDKNFDNGPLIVEELKIKQELAALLDFKCFAEYSLVKKMLGKPEEVLNFLQALIAPIKKQAVQDIAELKNFAEKALHITDIQSWDIGFVTEKLLEKKYAYSEEQLRSYFPANQVIEGLFLVVKKLFNITIKPVDTFEAWDSSVQLFEMLDENHQLLGRFYFDLYARCHKRKGAWCDSCKTRKEKLDGSIQLPIAYVVCNFRPALEAGQEALLNHEEVITLFHEFGHCLHFILAKTNYPSIAPGKGVSWDAIELPSQLMENWCWEEEVMPLISKHIKTDEPLPLDLFSKLKNSKNFQIGLRMIRQLEFALFDFTLHMQENIKAYSDMQTILDQVREKTAVFSIPEFNRFPNTFSHIFAGGYAAGYYSYLWSEVLSADTYHFFKENQQVFDKNVAKRYLKDILEPGGSKNFMDLYLAFRGRPPKIEALLMDFELLRP